MRFLLFNGPKNTTAAPVPVTTGAATLKTLLQIKPLVPCRIIEWGISFDAFAAAAPGTVELFESDVAATVTAFVAADITPSDGDALALNSGDPTTDYISVGTTASGYTATGEGTTTVARNISGPLLLPPTQPFIIQKPLGEQSIIQKNKFLRIRTKFAGAVNALCYVELEF